MKYVHNIIILLYHSPENLHTQIKIQNSYGVFNFKPEGTYVCNVVFKYVKYKYYVIGITILWLISAVVEHAHEHYLNIHRKFYLL